MTLVLPKDETTDVGDIPTVLIVDDEPAARKLLRTVVEQLDAPVRVEEAADADAVMEIVRRARPDLVLLDITLPDSRASGVILCQVLASDARTRVVIVTGNATESILHTCLTMGALECVRKPFNVEQMRSNIARWLDVPDPPPAS